jgi:hypothetical protein
VGGVLGGGKRGKAGGGEWVWLRNYRRRTGNGVGVEGRVGGVRGGKWGPGRDGGNARRKTGEEEGWVMDRGIGRTNEGKNGRTLDETERGKRDGAGERMDDENGEKRRNGTDGASDAETRSGAGETNSSKEQSADSIKEGKSKQRVKASRQNKMRSAKHSKQGRSGGGGGRGGGGGEGGDVVLRGCWLCCCSSGGWAVRLRDGCCWAAGFDAPAVGLAGGGQAWARFCLRGSCFRLRRGRGRTARAADARANNACLRWAPPVVQKGRRDGVVGVGGVGWAWGGAERTGRKTGDKRAHGRKDEWHGGATKFLSLGF